MNDPGAKNRLSIVIPTLNESRQIGRLLGCLNRQTYKDFETIIVDATGDDSTIESVTRHKGLLDAKILGSVKRNVAHQRNIGVKKAANERILFLDADVMFNKEFIRALAESDMQLGTVKYRFYDSHFLISGFLAGINIVKRLTARIHPISMGFCLLTTKRIHEAIGGFNEDIRFASDLDYAKRAGKAGRFTVDHSIVVHTSARRFNTEGNRRTFNRWMQAYFRSFRKDGLLKNNTDYRFGNHKE